MSRIAACRSCGSPDGAALVPVLDLGGTPLANRLLTSAQLDDPEPIYPLDLAFCPHCTLLQITETVPPEILFRDYLYFSSFSDTMLRHCRESAEKLIEERKLGPESLVVEAASNDGYFLQFFAQRGVPVLGHRAGPQYREGGPRARHPHLRRVLQCRPGGSPGGRGEAGGRVSGQQRSGPRG